MNNDVRIINFIKKIETYYLCLSTICSLNDDALFFCKTCGLCFIQKPIKFNTRHPKDFCKGCSSLNSRRDSEVDFLENLIPLIPEYANYYFVSQYSREDLKAVEKPKGRNVRRLTSDVGILNSVNLSDMPVAIIEVNSSKYYNSLCSPQDNLCYNYSKKREYYKSKNIPFIEIYYPVSSGEIQKKIRELLN
jgi:hypothetical protein